MKRKAYRIDTSKTMVSFKEHKRFLKRQLRSLVAPSNTGFYTQTMKILVFKLFACI